LPQRSTRSNSFEETTKLYLLSRDAKTRYLTEEQVRELGE
jgi:hypothetical protein